MVKLYGEYVRELSDLVDEILNKPKGFEYANVALLLHRDGSQYMFQLFVIDGEPTRKAQKAQQMEAMSDADPTFVLAKMKVFMRMTEFLAFSRAARELRFDYKTIGQPVMETLISYQRRNQKTTFQQLLIFAGFNDPTPHETFPLVEDERRLFADGEDYFDKRNEWHEWKY